MAESPREDLHTTLQLVKRQLELEQISREEQQRKDDKEAEARRNAVADEVEAEMAREKARIRKISGIIGAIFSALIALFSWSYSVVKEAQEKEILDEKRKTRVDLELKNAVKANAENSEKLSEHTKDFDQFQEDQREQERARQMEEIRQTEMLESVSRSLGRRPKGRSEAHKKAAKAAGWDIESDKD